MPGIFMASLGCAKNLVEAELMLGETLDENFHLVVDPSDADIVIINTCGFIEEARNEARAVIQEYIDLKKSSRRRPKVVATGCWAERAPEDVLGEFPDLDAVWGLRTPHAMGESLRALSKPDHAKVAGIGTPDAPAEGARLLTTLPSFAYLKISDGCDNRCHYCAIPLIRGGLKSRQMNAILDEAQNLADQGASELIIISQDTTAYGKDLGIAHWLQTLLEKLLATVTVPRIRVLYAHPAHIEDSVIDLIKTESRLCHYLDLPLQHIATPVLQAMGRGYGKERVLELLDKLRGWCTLRTTFLTGFPGETEEQFNEILDIVKTGVFHHLGAFAYSPEQGTPAFSLPDAIPAEVAARRRDAIMEAQSTVAFRWLDSRIGKNEAILVDSRLDRDWALGRSIHEAPDADGAVYLQDKHAQPGDIIKACIKARDGYDVIAARTGHEKIRRRVKRN